MTLKTDTAADAFRGAVEREGIGGRVSQFQLSETRDGRELVLGPVENASLGPDLLAPDTAGLCQRCVCIPEQRRQSFSNDGTIIGATNPPSPSSLSPRKAGGRGSLLTLIAQSTCDWNLDAHFKLCKTGS